MIRITQIILIIALGFCIAQNTAAQFIPTTDKLPLREGENVLAAGVWNRAGEIGNPMSLKITLTVNDEMLVGLGTPAKVLQPTGDVPDPDEPTGWTRRDFDDTEWQDGLAAMSAPTGEKRPIYTRVRFTIEKLSEVKNAVLNVSYDDSVVVWLNGVEIARHRGDLPIEPHWNSPIPASAGSGQIIFKSAKADTAEVEHAFAKWIWNVKIPPFPPFRKGGQGGFTS